MIRRRSMRRALPGLRWSVPPLFLVFVLAASWQGDSPPPTGTVVGRVEEPSTAPRRVANRYVGAEVTRARTVQPIPTAAWLEGAGPARAPGLVRIAQRDTAFEPALVVVPIGTTVEFPNHDPFFHNVFSYSSAKRFDLGRFPRGESRSVRFDEPGVVKIYCEVHEFMRAIVVVAREPLHDVVAGGRFTLRDVPAGRHRLTVWHPEKRPRELIVDVADGATTTIDVRFP